MPKYNAALMSIDPSETRRYAGLNKLLISIKNYFRSMS